MARHEDTRSPSPVGSTYSSSKRSRRDDDRYERSRRDVPRDRLRSRSPERRPRDRDRDRDRELYRRRDRSSDRRYDSRYNDNHYSSRREPDRDRRRSRERDVRRRSRERDYRPSRRDDSRDRERDRDRDRDRPRRHRDDSADSKKRKREDSRGPSEKSAGAKLPLESPKPPAASAEDEKAARLKKLEEWKRQHAATALQKSQASTPKTASPDRVLAHKPVKMGKPLGATSTTKKQQPLGADMIGIPVAAGSATPSVRSKLIETKPIQSFKPKGTLSGFSLGSKTNEAEVARKVSGFDDDEDVKKKLEKLPTLHDAHDETPLPNDVDEDDESEEVGNEEEALAADRAAAERRKAGQTADVDMEEATPAEDTKMEVKEEDTNMEVEEEEVDPLDAFMLENNAAMVNRPAYSKTQLNGKAKRQEPEAFFDDDDAGMTAVADEDVDDFRARAEEIARKKKKDIGTVNHDKVQYEPFRRNFYTEPVEMTDWTASDIDRLRSELDNIKVRGLDVPKPVQTWAQCSLGVQVLEVIQSLGYTAPTSIQAQAVPTIMSGRDAIGVAKTGSGKTIAFLLPMFRHIKDQRPLETLDGPIALVLSPTRELATQIHKECKPFAKALGLRSICAYGGAPVKDQIAEFKRGAEIVVCTPGRMIDILAANSGRVTNLKRVTYVVLDEADRMFDMGFEPQVMKILANIRPDKQTALFSATFPKNMEALARKTLKNPVEIIVGGRSVVAPEITQIVEVREPATRFHRLLELLGKLYEEEQNDDDRALIFVDRQDSADTLMAELMKKGYPCLSIHGGRDQYDRDQAIQDFKAGVVPMLVATSVAARGLDVKQLKLVVNYDAPNHLEDYVHRAGRTGRAGNKGTAVTFLAPQQDRYAVDIAKALKQSGQPVPEPVQKLADEFIEKVKAGKEKGYAGGFGGKGLDVFNKQRDAEKALQRKAFKGDGEDNEDTEDKDETKVAKVGDEIFKDVASAVSARDSKPVQTTVESLIPKHYNLDDAVVVQKTERATPSNAGANGMNKMDAVAAAAAKIHGKLSKAGTMRSGVPIDNKGPDAGAYHATIEINDFPQRARWGVTNRTNVAKILEATGTSITTKGNFYKQGTEPGPNDMPKLYILVEGDTEMSVTAAMQEIRSLIKEGLAAAAAEGDNRGGGRYSVV